MYIYSPLLFVHSFESEKNSKGVFCIVQQFEFVDEPSSNYHYAAIYFKRYTEQPKNKDMGTITNTFKNIGYAKPHGTLEILKALSSGQCAMLSNFEIINKSKSHLGDFRFISASAFAIDIDDDHQVTEPIKVLKDLKDICVGLFYTFSHGKKGNRYRLVFQLDQPITSLEDYKALVEYVMDYLKNKGLPVDTGAKSPTQVVRPGILGYEINDLSTALPVNEWLPKARLAAEMKRAATQKERAEQFKESIYRPTTFDELKEMCEAIGYIAGKQGDEVMKKWLRIVYALKNEIDMGNLSEEQGYELYGIISGQESDERFWKWLMRSKSNIKDEDKSTVGTIRKYAREAGYKRKHSYHYAMQEPPEPIPVEIIKVDGHLTAEVIKDLIERKQRLLVDSPTGSRKTSTSIQAFKELYRQTIVAFRELWKQNKQGECHFYIFSAPTIPLTEQVAKEHDIPCIKGGMTNLKTEVVNRSTESGGVYVCTYDKTAEVIQLLTEGIDHQGIEPKFTVIVDEIHKFTEAYNYRYAAIDKIKNLAEKTVSFIGLSGTPEDVLKENFDKLIKIDTGDNTSPCKNYRVFTYEKKADADVMLIPTIQELLKRTKLLLFINDKDRITRIRDILRYKGISTKVVTSDTKKSPTYLDIVENKTITDDVQVVISTSVLADGVTILNKPDWSCLVVTDVGTRAFFNPSTIKQISNRFREPYQYFGLYMLQPNPDDTETTRFSIEAEYQYRKRIVSRHVNYLNEEFKEDYKEFIPSVIEKNNGIFYRSQDEQAIIEFNPLFVRHESMKKKEMYYLKFRNAFIKEVGQQLGIACSGVYNINEIVNKKGSDLSELFAIIEEQQDQERKESAELRQAFSLYFDESVYQCFLNSDEEILGTFKKHVHADQFAATRRNVTIADYETCRTVGEKVKRKADVNKYFNHIKALAEMATFEYVKKTNITKKVFNELLKIANESYASSDFKDLIEKKLPKRLKVQASDVKAGLQFFQEVHSRTGTERRIQIKPLTIEIVAAAHAVPEKAIKNSLIKYAWSKNAHQQKILLPAIQEKWSVESYEK